ncbi:hypothetical protein K8R03_01695 [Candidatus Kaiserbacteria bacterium]|nr:hypothetical protein [Candidatus Kaiserbacteria bacterium]
MLFGEGFARRILMKRIWRSDELLTAALFRNKLLWKIPFKMDVYALAQSQYWPREMMAELQDVRLREIVKSALHLPPWKDTLTDASDVGIASFANLPVTSKDDLRELHTTRHISDRRDKGWNDHTSGSTGKPFHFMHDSHYELRSYAICDRMFKAAGGGAQYPVITMRSRPRRGMFLGSNGILFYLRSYNNLRHRLRALIALASRFPDGVIVQSFSSSLVELARLMQEEGTTLPIRAIIGTGEGLSDTQRHNIEDALKTKLYMAYTARELGWLGFECEEHRLHINEEWAYLEVVDSSGATVPDGNEGRILVTTFDNLATPFIRYDTGDRGVIDSDSCPCGRTLRTLRLTGRVVELISLPGGRTVSLLDLSATFDRYWQGVRQYQIVRKEELSYLIRYIPGDRFDEIKAALEATLIRILHPHVRIEWEQVDSIPESEGGKAVYFINEQVHSIS